MSSEPGKPGIWNGPGKSGNDLEFGEKNTENLEFCGSRFHTH